jgi:hypothetical protein
VEEDEQGAVVGSSYQAGSEDSEESDRVGGKTGALGRVDEERGARGTGREHDDGYGMGKYHGAPESDVRWG